MNRRSHANAITIAFAAEAAAEAASAADTGVVAAVAAAAGAADTGVVAVAAAAAAAAVLYSLQKAAFGSNSHGGVWGVSSKNANINLRVS